MCGLAEKTVETVCELTAVVSFRSCFIWRKGSWDGNISADKTFEWPDYDNSTVDCSWWYFFYFLFLFLRWERQTDEGNHLKFKEIPMLLLLSRFSHVRLCATPQMAAHQAPPSLGFSRQEHWNGLPFPPPMHESEKWKWSRSVVSDSLRPRGLQPTRLLRPWDFPGKSTGGGCHCLLLYVRANDSVLIRWLSLRWWILS